MSQRGEARTFCITTLGCKANQYDTAAMEEGLLSTRGLREVPFPGPADVCIINTCTVTASSDAQSRQLIRRARRRSPEAVIIVTGCYAEVSAEELQGVEEADYILGNRAKAEVMEYLERGRRKGRPVVVRGPAGEGVPWSLRTDSASGRTRMNLKIQDGCDRHCSYCIIPRARGASRSLGPDKILAEVRDLAARGFREIILTGIHLGAWGRDLEPRESLPSLLRLLDKEALPCRFRISSLDPDEVTDELVDILKESRSICNHLHLALQSGDDGILRAMRRTHGADLFREKVLTLTEAVADISIGVDVIAGFPGEGEAEFNRTYRLLEDLPVAYLHVFPFSPRRGTLASEMSARVPGPVIKERSAMLRALGEEKKRAFYERFVGSEAEVIVEAGRYAEPGQLRGKTRNYIPVLVRPGLNLPTGEITTLVLGGPLTSRGLYVALSPSKGPGPEAPCEALAQGTGGTL